MKPSHPEIEARTAVELVELSCGLLDHLSTTSIDLLEIHYQPNWKVAWNKNLDHGSLLKHVDNADVANMPALRIFFLGPRSTGHHGVKIHPSTVNWLQDRFAVSSVFLESILQFQFGASDRTGSAFLPRRNGCGKVFAIEGFYEILGHDLSKPHVWFLYDMSTKATTYLIAQCSESTKGQIVNWVHDQNSELLSRPFAVDAFIADDCSRAIQARLDSPRNELVSLEQRGASQFPDPQDMSQAFETLHFLSQSFHFLHGDLADIEEVIEFLLSIRKKYFSALTESQPVQAIYQSDSSVDESLAFLLSRNHVWKRWIANYVDRTQIRINLVFNLASQIDSRTQLEIAHLTSEIAIDAQRDSSSMITIAAVTLFFLPSTAICAIFSMVFFHTGTDATGRSTLAVSPQLWYFFAISIPLTILVFAVWTVWQWYRGRRRLSVVSKSKTHRSVGNGAVHEGGHWVFPGV